MSPIDVNKLYENALAQHRLGNIDEAELNYREIIEIAPTHAGALHFLGLILHKKAKTEEALQYIERSIQICNTKPVYYNNLAIVLKDIDKFEESKSALLSALSLAPDYPDAHSNLGLINILLEQFDEAEKSLEKALKLKPNHADALKHLAKLKLKQGNLWNEQENFEKADKAYGFASSLPTGKTIWQFKKLGFCPTVFLDIDSIDHYWQNLNTNLDNALYSHFSVEWEALPRDGFFPSFNLPHLGHCCREVKEKFAKIFQKFFQMERPTFQETMRGRSKIRIGFVVTAGHQLGFIRVHRILVENLSPKRFEVFFFSHQSIVDVCKKQISSKNIVWRPFSDRFSNAVEIIRESRCDILYHWKIGGGIFDYFLPFAKLAPVQCTSYGTHGTSGVEDVDYYLSSKILEESSSQNHYTEKLYLLNSYATSHEKRSTTPVSRNELGLR